MKKLIMITGLAIASLFYSCGKSNVPAPVTTIDGNNNGNGNTGGGDNSGGNGGNTGGGSDNKPWTIINVIRTYEFGSEYLQSGTDGSLQLEEIQLSNGDQQTVSVKANGNGQAEWLNAPAPVFKRLDEYTFDVTLPNALTKDAAVLTDTASKTIPFLRIRIPDAVNKKMTIYYFFVTEPFDLSNKKTFTNLTVDAAIFNAASKTNTASVTLREGH